MPVQKEAGMGGVVVRRVKPAFRFHVLADRFIRPGFDACAGSGRLPRSQCRARLPGSVV